MFQETAKLEDLRRHEETSLESRQNRELDDFDARTEECDIDTSTWRSRRSFSSVSNTSTSSETSARSNTENNGTVVQEGGDARRLTLNAGPLHA